MKKNVENVPGHKRPIITVGHHVSDHGTDLRKDCSVEGASSIYDVLKYNTSDDSFIFDDNVWVRVVHSGQPLYYRPGSAKAKLQSGGKYGVEVLTGKAFSQVGNKKVVIKPETTAQIGGGAFNVAHSLRVITDVPIRYIGHTHPQDESITATLEKLEISPTLFADIEEVQANLVIQRVYDKRDIQISQNRIILKGPTPKFPTGAQYELNISGPGCVPGTVVIDSLKDKPLADRTIDDVIGSGSLGIVAMTESTPWEIRDKAFRAHFIPIFNEVELAAYSGVKGIIDSQGNIYFNKVVEALRILRGIQGEQGYEIKTPIYVTFGDLGSLRLGEDDKVTFMQKYNHSFRYISTNAAGDTFAAGVVLMEHKKKYGDGDDHKHILYHSSLILQIASAMAIIRLSNETDSVRHSFNDDRIDRLLRESHINYTQPVHIDLIDSTTPLKLCDVSAPHIKGHTSLLRELKPEYLRRDSGLLPKQV